MEQIKSIRTHAIFLLPSITIGAAIVLPPLLYIVYTSVNGPSFTLAAYGLVLSSRLFQKTLATTLMISALSCSVSLALGYIVALHLARLPTRQRAILLGFVLLPLWTSILVKCFAFTIILGREGIINSALSWLFGTTVQLPLVLSRAGTLIGMINWQVPLVVLPILASLLEIDSAIYRAASIMGARPARIFWTVTVPMSLPGVFAGILSIFVMSLGSFMVPALLGGPQDQMLSNLVDFYNREVLDWPKASTISIILFAISLLFAAPMIFWRRRKSWLV